MKQCSKLKFQAPAQSHCCSLSFLVSCDSFCGECDEIVLQLGSSRHRDGSVEIDRDSYVYRGNHSVAAHNHHNGLVIAAGDSQNHSVAHSDSHCVSDSIDGGIRSMWSHWLSSL